MEAFSVLLAPRPDNRKVHALFDTIGIAAFICGADYWTEVEVFAEKCEE